jgi:hypothetical protein
MMSMMAITIRVWIQLPVFGKLELTFRPKKPANHKTTRTMITIHKSVPMVFLLGLEIYKFIGCRLVAVDQGTVAITVVNALSR